MILAAQYIATHHANAAVLYIYSAVVLIVFGGIALFLKLFKSK